MEGPALFFELLAGGATLATLAVGGCYGVVEKRMQLQQWPRAAARKAKLQFATILTLTGGLAMLGYIVWFTAVLSPATNMTRVGGNPLPQFSVSIDRGKSRNVLIWGDSADDSNLDRWHHPGKDMPEAPLGRNWSNAGWQNQLAELTPTHQKVACDVVYQAYLKSFHETGGPGEADAFEMIMLASRWSSYAPEVKQWMELSSDASGKKYYERKSESRVADRN